MAVGEVSLDLEVVMELTQSPSRALEESVSWRYRVCGVD